MQHSSGPVRFGILAALLVVLAVPLALLPLPWAALLVAAAVGGMLALIDPVWAVCWAVLSVPVQETIHLPGGLTVTQVTLLTAAASWLLRTLATPQRFVRWGPLGVPFLAVLAAMGVSTIFTPYSPLDGFKETLRWAWVALVYLIVVNSTTDRRQMGILVTALVVAPTSEALYGLWQFVTASGPPSFLVAGGRFARAYGTIGQPNSFAGYMNMAWPLAAALGASAVVAVWRLLRPTHAAMRDTRPVPISRTTTLLSIPAAVAALILLAGLAASFSRGGWVGALGGATTLCLAWLSAQNDQRSRAHLHGRILVGVCAGGVLILVVALLNTAGMLPDAVANRLDSIVNNVRLFDVRTAEVTPDNFAVVERMAHIQAGWGMFSRYPLLGVGPGNFTPAYGDFAIPPWLISQGHAHNYYLHSAAEGGIIGALAYLALLAAVARLCAAALRHSQHQFDRMIAIGGCGMMGAVAVHNVFENLHVLNIPIQLGAVWGLLVVIYGKQISPQR